MKSYQFFKIYKRFIRKRKNSHTAENEKRKTEKIFFYLTGYFMKLLKMAINHFFFSSSFYSKDFFYFASLFTAQFLIFNVRITQEISKGEIGNDK